MKTQLNSKKAEEYKTSKLLLAAIFIWPLILGSSLSISLAINPANAAPGRSNGNSNGHSNNRGHANAPTGPNGRTGLPPGLAKKENDNNGRRNNGNGHTNVPTRPNLRSPGRSIGAGRQPHNRFPPGRAPWDRDEVKRRDVRLPVHSRGRGNGRPGDNEAYGIIRRAHGGALKCERAGDMLQNASNQINELAILVRQYEKIAGRNPQPPRGRHQGDYNKYIKAKRNLEDRDFWEGLWDRLAQVYSSCERDCFDQGFSIGQISGTGYCSASVALDGLRSDIDGEIVIEPPLPMCEESIHVGCVQGYNDVTQSFPGCLQFATGDFADLYVEFRSQDCAI